MLVSLVMSSIFRNCARRYYDNNAEEEAWEEKEF